MFSHPHHPELSWMFLTVKDKVLEWQRYVLMSRRTVSVLVLVGWVVRGSGETYRICIAYQYIYIYINK